MTELNIEGRTRKDILIAALKAGKTGAHIAPSLSLVEIVLAVLMNSKEREQLILSKGHGGLGYYAAMHQLGLITKEQFDSFEENGGEFPGQPSRSDRNRVQYSSGSLGMGLSYGVGLAYANPSFRQYVILGDGEMNEGSVWEAAALAVQLKLGNLVAIIDNNGMQSDGTCAQIMGLDLRKILEAYGWNVVECDGHSIVAVEKAICAEITEKPLAILARTVKGKGISFMEHNNEWHHHELKSEEYEAATAEIGERYGLCKK